MKKGFSNLPLDKIPDDEKFIGEPADKKNTKERKLYFRKLFKNVKKS